MKFMRFVPFLLFSIFILANSSYPQAQILRLTPKELHNHLKKYLRHRRDTEWAKYKGKTIRWTGNPRPFGTRGITDQGFLIDLGYKGETGYVGIRAYFPEKEAGKLFKVSEYDSLVFEGKLSEYSSGSSVPGYNFLVENAKLIKVNVARSILSIVGYKFNVGASPLSGDYEFMEFDVTLRNDGKLPLRGTTLDVVFGDVRGTERNVFVRPEEAKEIRIWIFAEWTVNGQKKMPPFHIPDGNYKGIIELRDDNGRLIASRSCYRALPPVERRPLR